MHFPQFPLSNARLPQVPLWSSRLLSFKKEKKKKQELQDPFKAFPNSGIPASCRLGYGKGFEGSAQYVSYKFNHFFIVLYSEMYVARTFQNPYRTCVDPTRFGCRYGIHTVFGQLTLGSLTTSMTKKYILIGIWFDFGFMSYIYITRYLWRIKI